MAECQYDIVIPTIGRPSLQATLRSLERASARPRQLVIVDDRRETTSALDIDNTIAPTALLRSGGQGPAYARNLGLNRCASPWIVFVDDDVEVSSDWARTLDGDLLGAGPFVAAIQGHVAVPLPERRRPTDWERNVARLSTAKWITADVAVRRQVIAAVGPFRTCFRRAYREDSDLALRLVDHGWRIEMGNRECLHPVSRADFWVSVRKQRGNADDALMRALHGHHFAERLDERPSMMRTHWLTVASAAVAVAARDHRTTRRLASAVWTWSAATFAWRRIAPGPRSPREVLRMIVTSLLIPPAACFWSVVGTLQARHIADGVRS